LVTMVALLACFAVGAFIADDHATVIEGAQILLAAPMVAATKGGKILGIKEACRIMKEIMQPLEKNRRVEILKNLPFGEKKSFEQLQADTGISAGSLHYHLKVLLELGYVHKTDERPARYYSNEYVEKLCELTAYWKERRLEAMTAKMSEFQEDGMINQET